MFPPIGSETLSHSKPIEGELILPKILLAPEWGSTC